VKNTISPHVYIVGRNASAAERIINECKALNADGRVEFIKGDVSELKEVDRICAEIQQKEPKLHLLVQTQGNLNLRGRDGSSPALAAPYPRMRDMAEDFISNNSGY
jgi:NAD(P)-dependent dehydrogenase (short-subunit alcohol dehydrogenase family)